MNFEWDEEKRQRNIRERGLDFIDVIPLFYDPNAHSIEDVRKDYGECRQILFGYLNTRLYQVCFTHREGNIRIISARRANSRERRQYEKFKQDHDDFHSGRAGSPEES